MPPASVITATCTCGSIEVRAFGKPIVCAACFCDDCQKGGAQIEALPKAASVRDPHGGTAYVLYRRDRVACTSGAERLKPLKLKETSSTNRVVATCCNSAMFMNFDKGPHWVSVYRARFDGDLPPLQARICTKFRPESVALPEDVPSYRSYPPGFIVKLLASRIAMALGM